MRVFMCFMALLLVGCASTKMATYHAQEVRACHTTCQQKLQECGQVCHDNCFECTQRAIQRAVRHDAQYLREQCVQGRIITRELKSYRDPLQCRKTTCNCWADYQVCAQSCTGIIHKQQ